MSDDLRYMNAMKKGLSYLVSSIHCNLQFAPENTGES